MSHYEIFDLLYFDVIEESDADNMVFTHKYVVGKQRIRKHLLKPDGPIDPVEILDFLNKLHVKYAYHSPLYFSSYSLKYQNITIFDFFFLKLRGLANVPAFLRFNYFMTHIVHFEKVNFLFFSLLKCQCHVNF